MKTPTRSRKLNAASPLPLHNGDRMTQKEFHRRYETYPEDVKIELIGGVVYRASSVNQPHGAQTLRLAGMLGTYHAYTLGVEAGDNQTVILGDNEEPQPDLLLRILPEYGGQTTVNDDQYLVGAPELVIEVAHSTRSIDLNAKKRDYLAAGVQEYLVFCVEEQEIFWFHFPSKRNLKADKQGVWKSKVFPGLWLNGPALIAADTAALLATVQQGLASAEHAAFVARLQAARTRRR